MRTRLRTGALDVVCTPLPGHQHGVIFYLDVAQGARGAAAISVGESEMEIRVFQKSLEKEGQPCLGMDGQKLGQT